MSTEHNTRKGQWKWDCGAKLEIGFGAQAQIHWSLAFVLRRREYTIKISFSIYGCFINSVKQPFLVNILFYAYAYTTWF